MNIVSLILLLIIIGGICGIVYIIVYNNLQAYTLKINEAEGLIDELLRKKYDDDVFNAKMYEWSKEFLTDNYKSDQYKKNAVFTKYYHDMLECMYLVINVSNACDYNKDEYDEIKVKYNLDKNSTDYLIMKKIYGDYSDFDSKVMELWNMSTFRRRYVMTKDIRVVILDTLDVNVIDILKYVYENYKNIKYDLLDDFMLWLKLNEGK